MELISREDVNKQLDFFLNHMEKQYHTILRCMYTKILDLPTIESRPKGKWVGIGYDGYADGNPVYDEWECSNCGHEIKTEDTPPYCEMCGAEMEIEE